MKGFVKLEAVTHEGKEVISCECMLKDVSTMDRMQMVHALMRSLQFNKDETEAFIAVTRAGVLNNSLEIADVGVDKSMLKDLLKELLR